MMLLPCPWCGPRNVAEFRYVGETRQRPDPAAATPEEWREYLYMQANPRGPVLETWLHRMGCRQYFRAERDTATGEVLGVLRAGQPSVASETASRAGDAPAAGGRVAAVAAAAAAGSDGGHGRTGRSETGASEAGRPGAGHRGVGR